MLIGELARQSGVSARMLRHYDGIGLVVPSGRTSGGYRDYAPDDVQRLFRVEVLRSLGLSLAEIGESLDDPSFAAPPMIARLMERTRERIAAEQDLLRRLGAVRSGDPTGWDDVLELIGLLRGLEGADASRRQREVLSAGRRDAVRLAEQVLAEDEPNVSGALQWALAQAGEAAVPVLADGLDSDAPQRRHRAVAALVKLGTAAALDVLAGALAHPDDVVRGRAALALGADGRVDAVPVLVSLVRAGRDDVEAAEVLGTLARQHGVADDVTASLVADLPLSPAALRRRVAAALAEIPGPAAVAALGSMTADADRGVALTATAVLRTRTAP